MSIACPICSKENPDSQEFCSLCGTLLRATGEPAKELSPEDVDAMLSTPALVEPVEPPRVEREASLPVETGPVEIPRIEPVEIRSRQARPTEPPRVEPVEPPRVGPVETPRVEPVETKPAPLPPPKPTSRRWSPRCLGIGCLGALIFLLVGAPLLHFFVIRPPLERALIKQIEERVGQAFTISIYSGEAQLVALSQNKANTLLEPLWDEKFVLKDGQVAFHQDSFIFTANWFTIPIEINADLRVDNNGSLIVKSLAMNLPARLLFTPESLSAAITRYVNDDILRPKNFFLLAFQVTEGDLFLAYRSR